MLILRCTRRVLDIFRETPRLVQVAEESQGLGEWYIHVIDDLDDTFFLCVNAQALYALILDTEPEMFQSTVELAEAMVRRLLEHLQSLGIDEPTLSKVAEGYRHVVVSKTASRSVLGSMNDLVNHICFWAGRQLMETGQLDLRAIEEELNTMPQRPIGWAFAKDRLVEQCRRLQDSAAQ